MTLRIANDRSYDFAVLFMIRNYHYSSIFSRFYAHDNLASRKCTLKIDRSARVLKLGLVNDIRGVH